MQPLTRRGHQRPVYLSSVFVWPSRSLPSGSSRYQGYPGHLQRASVLPDSYPAAVDSSLSKEQKSRGGLLTKHGQEQHGSSVKSETKLPTSSPGAMYPGSYPTTSSSSSGRSQHLLPPQENPAGRGESGTPGREKSLSKQMSEQDLRALGKTSATVTRFCVTHTHKHTPDFL